MAVKVIASQLRLKINGGSSLANVTIDSGHPMSEPISNTQAPMILNFIP